MIPVLFASCAALQEGDIEYQEGNLRQAGFEAVSVTTPDKIKELASLPPYQIVTVEKSGVTQYRYADPRRKLLYVGGPQEYAAYQEVLAQHQAQVGRNMMSIGTFRGSGMGPLTW